MYADTWSILGPLFMFMVFGSTPGLVALFGTIMECIVVFWLHSVGLTSHLQVPKTPSMEKPVRYNCDEAFLFFLSPLPFSFLLLKTVHNLAFMLHQFVPARLYVYAFCWPDCAGI